MSQDPKTKPGHLTDGWEGFVQLKEQRHRRVLEKNGPAQEGGPKRSEEKRGERTFQREGVE